MTDKTISNNAVGKALDAGAGEETVSLEEIIQVEDELVKNAFALLGSVDDKECTYDKGYLKRQPLYSCRTCQPSGGGEPAGVCLACSLQCHEDHDLVELYTKRNFRCDCGNDKFGNANPCCLQPAKDARNPQNRYDQTFRGLYCTCRRPYPDTTETSCGDADPLGDMVQCVMCEDWYHIKHLNLATPTSDDITGEVTCSGCMAKYPFLQFYAAQLCAAGKGEDKENLESDNLDVIRLCHTSASHSESQTTTVSKLEKDSANNSTSRQNGGENGAGSDDVGKIPEKEIAQIPEKEIVKIPEKETDLVEEENDNGVMMGEDGSLTGRAGQIWPDGWRTRLCRCGDCMESYASTSSQFLLDPEDTLEHYEAQAPPAECPLEQIDRNLTTALSTMGRSQQIEMIHGYQDLKTKLSEYLRGFADKGKVVTEADIKSFFEELTRTRPSPSVIQGFCR